MKIVKTQQDVVKLLHDLDLAKHPYCLILEHDTSWNGRDFTEVVELLSRTDMTPFEKIAQLEESGAAPPANAFVHPLVRSPRIFAQGKKVFAPGWNLQPDFVNSTPCYWWQHVTDVRLVAALNPLLDFLEAVHLESGLSQYDVPGLAVHDNTVTGISSPNAPVPGTTDPASEQGGAHHGS